MNPAKFTHPKIYRTSSIGKILEIPGTTVNHFKTEKFLMKLHGLKRKAD